VSEQNRKKAAESSSRITKLQQNTKDCKLFAKTAIIMS
jgi:hypothetical protein